MGLFAEITVRHKAKDAHSCTAVYLPSKSVNKIHLALKKLPPRLQESGLLLVTLRSFASHPKDSAVLKRLGSSAYFSTEVEQQPRSLFFASILPGVSAR